MTVVLKKKVESKIRANARRGARALDRIYPGWYSSRNLSLKRLDMQNACNCVWGQLGGLDKSIENEAFQAMYGKSHGTATPGYLPKYDPNDGQQCHVDEKAQIDWREGAWLPEEEQQLVDAIKDEEWRVLQDEWESLIRIRRRAARVAA